MVSTTHQEQVARSRCREREAERVMMNRLFFLVFPLCFIAIALVRISTVFSARDGRAEGSVFAEAKASAYAALGYAFHV
ncbi:MAG: hypothetical protein AAGF82_19685 [Pseudomonadota bacterium]